MEESWVHLLAEYVAVGVNVLAILAIAIGSIQGAFSLVGPLLARAPASSLRSGWLSFGRWLVLGLTFQLASDIVETTLAPGWDDIGKLGAIAVIRTFLNFFLDRDMESLRERGREERSEALEKAVGQPSGTP